MSVRVGTVVAATRLPSRYTSNRRKPDRLSLPPGFHDTTGACGVGVAAVRFVACGGGVLSNSTVTGAVAADALPARSTARTV